MKIVFLVNNINPGNGWGHYARDLINGLRIRGCSIVILKESRDNLEGKAIIRRGLGIIYSVLRMVIDKDVRSSDIIHAVDVYPFGVIAFLANIILRKKIIISALGTYSVAPLYGKISWIAKKSLKSMDRIVAISSFTKDQIQAAVPNLLVDVIKPGIDYKAFHIRHEDILRPYILSVGALKYRKGYHISIPAFAKARKDIPDLEYIIIGSQDNKYFEELKILAHKYGVEEGIKFIKNVPDDEMRQIYSRAKIFILTSINQGNHFEGFGLVFLEAAAAGLPVIGTLGNGIEDAIDAGHNGVLVPQGDIDMTSKNIVKMIKDKNLWASMSQESYKLSEQNDIDIAIDCYVDIYSNLVKNGL